ncbi:hypothetical protein Tco_1466758 [Tanacetum coccineum]
MFTFRQSMQKEAAGTDAQTHEQTKLTQVAHKAMKVRQLRFKLGKKLHKKENVLATSVREEEILDGAVIAITPNMASVFNHVSVRARYLVNVPFTSPHTTVVYCMDKTNITRKPSKTGKHEHGNQKSTKEAKDSKPKPRKVNYGQASVKERIIVSNHELSLANLSENHTWLWQEAQEKMDFALGSLTQQTQDLTTDCHVRLSSPAVQQLWTLYPGKQTANLEGMTNTQTPPTVVKHNRGGRYQRSGKYAEKPEKFNGQNYHDSPRLWESLERKYKTEDAGTKKFVVARFLDYKMVDSKSVVSQVQDLQVLLHDIHAEGMTLSELSETFQAATIIEKLPPS